MRAEPAIVEPGTNRPRHEPMGPVDYIKATVDRYVRLGHDPYRYFHAEEAPPWAVLRKPLPDSRLGVVATAGAYVKGQVAFHYKDDTSFRRIPKAAPLEDLRFSHVTEHYLGSARRDPNSVIPLDSLRRLEREGLIGALAEDLFSCMGGIYSQRRVRDELAPALAEQFARQEVDVVLLVPM